MEKIKEEKKNTKEEVKAKDNIKEEEVKAKNNTKEEVRNNNYQDIIFFIISKLFSILIISIFLENPDSLHE